MAANLATFFKYLRIPQTSSAIWAVFAAHIYGGTMRWCTSRAHDSRVCRFESGSYKPWEPPFPSGASISPMGPFIPPGDAMAYILGSYPGFAGSTPALANPFQGLSCDYGSPQTGEGCFRMRQIGHIFQICTKRAYSPCQMGTSLAAYNTSKPRKEELAH